LRALRNCSIDQTTLADFAGFAKLFNRSNNACRLCGLCEV